MSRILIFLGRYIQAVAAHFVLIIVGCLPRYRAALYESAYQLGWRSRPPKPPGEPPLTVPAVDAAALIGREVSLRLVEPDSADGNVTGYELLVISALASKHGRTACFEIGTFDGRTALNLAANTPPDCHVFTLDLPSSELGRTGLAIAHGDETFINKPTSGARFHATPYAARITQLLGDSASFDYTPYWGKMDLVFVDGSHSYEYVKADTETARKLLKPEGGIILWHDYGSPYWKDLTRALNELQYERGEFASMRHIRGTTVVGWVKQG
ncbi:MAG TPA: class I SAM-dependent methyltransferase [Kiritimatiellia bacterium]|nr:class I SAM-dependent methyltransferase [Kiritimatiellia bacterium]